MSVDLSDEVKETLMNVLRHAASEDRSVIEFRSDGENLTAAEITKHVETLESQNE
jgi:hypothetical protein